MSNGEIRTPKLGEGHAPGMIRAGAKEIGQVLVAFPNGSIHPVEEPGVLGNPTQQIVTAEMGGRNSYNDMLERHANRNIATRDTREVER